MQVNVAGLRRNIKNLAHNYSDAQVKVREATSNDPWGPSATIMAELAELTNNVVAFSEIMQMIWKRLNDHGKNWRHVYKALILLEYLIKTGNEKVSQQCKENIFAIQTLREFVYHEEGKDQGNHVREKAKQLVNLLKDDERLKNERIKALKAKERFAQYPSGFGSDGCIDGPIARDMPPGWQEEPAKPTSELEMVRPQTAGEEELQLQLAMAMSREEAEQEEAKRRSDDVRLQLALSQSEQDFKNEPNFRQTKPPKEEPPQSHLLDLLDIQLGATSISSPPLGLAAGGLTNTTDPWITPARAASQMSDPWTGTASPPVDPWMPTAASRSTPLSAAHMGAMGGSVGGGMGAAMALNSNGTNGSEAWGGMRTQSPSVTSGSSTEGWLQTNGNTHAASGIAATGGAAVDPWQSTKPTAAAANTIATVDAWLSESNRPSATATPPKTLLSEDPWAPKAGSANADPWKHIESSAVKPSPDMDEFDIITNRNKSGGSDLLNINNSLSNVSNNNANLLDDLDPLSTTNSTISASTGATSKRPLKDPQSFLGENSGLVNLDNLIKPAVAQNTLNAAAYNPFSDTVIPPKPNLFQQQQPAVPSINQLKQQSFQMTINQDPWAPASNTTTSQFKPTDPSPLNRGLGSLSELHTNNDTKTSSNHFSYNAHTNVLNTSYGAPAMGSTMKYSKSDYDAFRSALSTNSNRNIDHFYNTSVNDLRQLTLDNDTFMDSFDLFKNGNNANSSHLSYPSLYPHVEIINNNDVYATVKASPPSSPTQSSSPSLSHAFAPYAATTNNNNITINPIQSIQQPDVFNTSYNTNTNTFNNNNKHNYDNNNFSYSYNNNNTSLGPSAATATATIPNAIANPTAIATASSLSNSSASYATNYSNLLSASLATAPGVTIMPLNQLQLQQQQPQQPNVASNLFGYGFYDTTNTTNMTTTDLNTQCKLENNNNMPWMKPEAAASNPFLS
ncbi:epsin-1 isoform X3 [Stomoxys calcitrans]|nr:epsin-1 isoform X3 [Stomoxys calcitrans]XP_059217167.1 epsin-1 isoform X3 [Stomoxys calcitrans]XP_059217168.1 epsin-1 isoform X3 [Stomoxys calcitrans]